MDFKEQALSSLSSEIRARLEARGVYPGKDFFGASVHIEEWGEGNYRYVSDQEVFDVFVDMMKGLRDRIFDINTIICDPGGGMIPTDMAWKLTNLKREEVGLPHVRNVFALRPKGEDISFVESFVASRNNEDKSFGRTLILTELIRNGSGVRRLADIFKRFKKYGLEFDVASISAVKRDTIAALESEYGIKIFVGEMDLLGTGEVFHRRSFNGVRQGDYVSGSAYPQKDDRCDPDEIRLSRKVASFMALEAANIITR